MASLPKCRRVKRPTTLAKRSQMTKKSIYNKRSYKPLYEKLKGNNNALAKALSKEKQECQYLFSENLALTSQVQELGSACNKRDDMISDIMNNAKETLTLLVNLTHRVTNTIASCQQFVPSTKFTPREAAASPDRRESNRRLSGKSPARGVVQPMVGGHTITKPTINLSRLNIQREYRIRNSPNLSDIEEVSTSPVQSPPQASTSVRLPITNPLNCIPRRVDRLPERLKRSLRTSDESERRSSIRGERSSGRNTPRRSRRDSELTPRPEVHEDERLKSPRVSLLDVSRLLHNSQSVNIRKLLEQSNTAEATHPEIVSNVDNETLPVEAIAEDSKKEEATPSCRAEEKSKRENVSLPSEMEDPLEGPSWLLNDSEPSLNSEEPRGTSNDSSTKIGNTGNGKINKDNRKTSRLRINDEEPEMDEEDNDDDQTVNLATRWAVERSQFYPRVNADDDTDLPNFVTRKRGSYCDDTDDFTLMWRGPTAPRNNHFDLNDLQLPVLESPLVKPPMNNRIPETDPTTANLPIVTQNLHNFTSGCPNVDPNDDSILDRTGLVSPSITDNLHSIVNSVVEPEVRTSEDDDNYPASRKRKKIEKNKRNRVGDSPNDSDWSSTPKRKNLKSKRKTRAKDPSSAKVVLQKLEDDRSIKSFCSPEVTLSQEQDNNRSASSLYRELSSDSEVSSNASSKLTSDNDFLKRPRRQKAPKNLQEPSLQKKLRRH